MSEETSENVQNRKVVSARLIGNMVAIDADFACRYPLTPSFSYRTGVIKADQAIDRKLALFVKGSDPETSAPFSDEIAFTKKEDLETVIADLDNLMVKYANDPSQEHSGGRF